MTRADERAPDTPAPDALALSAADLGLGALLAVCCVEPLALWPLTLGITALLALALALPLGWWRMRRGSGALNSWAIAAPLALACVLAAQPWSLRTGWPIGVACLALFASAPLWVGLVRRQRAFAVALTAIAVLTLWGSARVYVGLYATLHVAAVLLGLGLAALGVNHALQLERHPKLARAIALGMVGLAALSWTPWATRNEARQLAVSRPCLAPHLLAIAWALTDLDGDGASTLLGGADCDALDPDRGPTSWDVPGDGIDQDCTGSDRRLAVATQRAPVKRVRSVLIVTADSLRADALGAYGSQPLPVSVHIDAWAKGAVRFERAYAAAPETRASLPVLLRGQNGPPSATPSLAQRVADAGMPAYAVLSQHASFGDDVRGAGFALTEVAASDSAQLTAAARQPLAEIAARGGVLWVHYHDPHAPYAPVPGIDWGSDDRARYLGLVTRMDRAFGALLEGVPSDMAVIFSADHGEAFGEHGMYYHRSSLYDEQIRIPLALAVPGIAPRVVPETVGLIDLYATALDLLGMPATPRVASRSLVPALLGETLPDAPYRATTWNIVDGPGASRSWVGVFYGRFKLLRRTDWNVDEVYDLRADPRELTPNTPGASAMRATLIDLL